MNKTKQYNAVLHERAKDLETLICYFSVTRVLHCEEYHDKAGGFSFRKFKTQKGWIVYWNDKDKKFKDKNYKTFSVYQTTFNETLGIPCELMNDILGRFGTSTRFRLKDVLAVIGGDKKWKVVDDGQDAYTVKETGERIVKKTWFRKIYPANGHEWYQYLTNGSYNHLETIPNASKRAIEIIKGWAVAKQLLPHVNGGIPMDALEGRLSRTYNPSLVKRIMTWLNRFMKQQKGQ